MAQLVIFGAGVTAELATYYFENDSEHDIAAYCVDERYRRQSRFLDRPVVAAEEVGRVYPPESFDMFVALSYTKLNRVRADRYRAMRELGYRLRSYVSSRATVLTPEPIGDNCFILEDNTIQPFVKIGSNVTLWSGNHLGHHSRVGDHCFITSQVVVSGNCEVGEYSFLGVNATIRDSLKIAPRTLIGAGAVIMQDTVEGGVYKPAPTVLASKSSSKIEL